MIKDKLQLEDRRNIYNVINVDSISSGINQDIVSINMMMIMIEFEF